MYPADSADKVANHFSHDQEVTTSDSKHHGTTHALPPISMYFKVFFVLLFLIALNMGIAQIPGMSTTLKTIAILGGASIQAILVFLFYMELIYENKFYFFILISTIMFIGLFAMITLIELKSRDFFNPLESIDTIRNIEKNALYPGIPNYEKSSPSK
ncbi:MAG: cytochrome C oxidase subunit IV family protein [Silvanigrellaceae bacterium]|nr:cytochrome C oxidase subunit IV family protein [Silvanigrellaceae bacterium]